MIIRPVDLSKTTVVLACALGFGAVAGSLIQAQTIPENPPTVESICQARGTREIEVVVEPSVFEQQEAEEAERLSLQFQQLVQQWREERGATSSLTKAAMMPAYQRVVGMGKKAIPLILAQLRSEGNEPDQWFWALRVITEADPVRPEDQGNFRAMAHAWLAWGESEGYAG
jgi:hypothetical protein